MTNSLKDVILTFVNCRILVT